MLNPMHQYGDGARRAAALDKKEPKKPSHPDDVRDPGCFKHEEECGNPDEKDTSPRRDPLAKTPKTVL